MSLHQAHVTLATQSPIQVVDISARVKDFAASCGVRDGLIVVASGHTTLGVVINERCDRLQEDMVDFLARLAPPEADYRHNRVAVDGRPNAHSHLLSLMIPSSVTLVMADGSLQLGAWQSVFAIELDGPRPSRQITLTAMGAAK